MVIRIPLPCHCEEQSDEAISPHDQDCFDNQTLEILDNARRREIRSMPLTNSPFYPTSVTDTLRRIAAGSRLPI